MRKFLLILATVFVSAPCNSFAQASVRVEPPDLHDFRPMPEHAGTSAIRDYLESWQSFKSALEQNRAALLDPDFVGMAKDKLTETIQQQASLGMRTKYQDRSHDMQIVFNSPEGSSIELTDKVEYDLEVFDHDTLKTKQHMSARFVIVLTLAELRWSVRVFQANPA